MSLDYLRKVCSEGAPHQVDHGLDALRLRFELLRGDLLQRLAVLDYVEVRRDG
jgi:hypothetical protein